MIGTDAYGLHEVANVHNKSRLADIVFLHGIGGNSHATWRYGRIEDGTHFFWPEELGKQRPNCGVWTIGYPAGLNIFGPKGMMIEKRGMNIAQTLVNNGIGSRPIIFIAHSMGGLILKSLFVNSSILPDADISKISNSTHGIVFLSTPHRGSEYSNAAGVLFSLIGGSQEHLNEMKSASESLDLLHDKFIEWQRRSNVPICSYAENIGLFRKRRFLRPIPLGVVVNRASANPGIAGHVVRDVDEDHLSIAKPNSNRHDIYVGTLRFLDGILFEIGIGKTLKDCLDEIEHFLRYKLIKSLEGKEGGFVAEREWKVIVDNLNKMLGLENELSERQYNLVRDMGSKLQTNLNNILAQMRIYINNGLKQAGSEEGTALDNLIGRTRDDFRQAKGQILSEMRQQ